MGQTISVDAPSEEALFEDRKWRWTAEDFTRLGELGVFPAEQKFELIEGEIVQMSPPNPPHSGRVNLVYDILKAAFGAGFCVRTEQPLRIGSEGQPQPDIAVCVGRLQDYFQRFPTAAEARLIVEIADSTVEFDRDVKGPLYAAAGIADYWILNLRDASLEVYREPVGAEYRLRRVYRGEETVTPLSAPTARLTVSALLGEEDG